VLSACAAGAVFFAAAFFATTFFTAAFLGAFFFRAAGFDFAASAFFAAHLFLRAFKMLAPPVELSFRFGLAGSGVAGAGGSDSPRIFAYRRC